MSDHDMDQDRIDAAIADAKAFFALPEEIKKQYAGVKGGARGYIPFGIETAKGATHSRPEGILAHRPRPAARPPVPRHHGRQCLAGRDPGFQHDVSWLYNALDSLGGKVLEAIATYLKLDRDFFEPTVENGNSVLRLLHYPPIPKDATGVRAGAHGDINTITLLMGAEEGGLELQDRNGDWLPINPPPGCIVVNIGDMLERLTNHVLPSTIHRVQNPPPERRHIPRYSTPFFLHFASDYLIKTLPGCVTPENPDRYPEPITADEFLQQRLREIKLA
jgi:isopenicillin N synthase-like dioxygenase